MNKPTPPNNTMKTQNKKRNIATSVVIAALTVTCISSVQANEDKNPNATASSSGKLDQTKTTTAIKVTPQKKQHITDLTSQITTLITFITNPAPIIVSAPIYYIWKKVSQ